MFWEADKQVEDLLTDIEEAYTNDFKKEYFIGTSVVFNDNGVYELIDGQKRTTTLFLALGAFKSVYEENGLSHDTIDKCIIGCRNGMMLNLISLNNPIL